MTRTPLSSGPKQRSLIDRSPSPATTRIARHDGLQPRKPNATPETTRAPKGGAVAIRKGCVGKLAIDDIAREIREVNMSSATFSSTGCGPNGWRCYWQARAANDHTDWISLIDAAAGVLARLRILYIVSVSS
jgi:hypothetical protein